MNQKTNNGFRISGRMVAGMLLTIAVLLLLGIGGWMVNRAEAAVAKAEAAERAVIRVEGDVKAIHARLNSVDEKLDMVMEYTRPKEQ